MMKVHNPGQLSLALSNLSVISKLFCARKYLIEEVQPFQG